VLVGRPILWGLAAGGREGAAAALAILRREFDLAMALCGCARVDAVARDLVAPGEHATPRTR
jgi:isopentenyl diphosphate isomerase/L-lactate dehydrogenase-like FMN-dependent dehydrogenase